MEIDVLPDRESSFEPKIVRKCQKDISSIEDKIIAIYAKGLTIWQISEQIEDMYGFKVSKGMASDITNKRLSEIENWRKRPLSSVYPIVFVDDVHFSVRGNNIIRKLAAYIILRINYEDVKSFDYPDWCK